MLSVLCLCAIVGATAYVGASLNYQAKQLQEAVEWIEVIRDKQNRLTIWKEEHERETDQRAEPQEEDLQ